MKDPLFKLASRRLLPVCVCACARVEIKGVFKQISRFHKMPGTLPFISVPSPPQAHAQSINLYGTVSDLTSKFHCSVTCTNSGQDSALECQLEIECTGISASLRENADEGAQPQEYVTFERMGNISVHLELSVISERLKEWCKAHVNVNALYSDGNVPFEIPPIESWSSTPQQWQEGTLKMPNMTKGHPFTNASFTARSVSFFVPLLWPKDHAPLAADVTSGIQIPEMLSLHPHSGEDELGRADMETEQPP